MKAKKKKKLKKQSERHGLCPFFKCETSCVWCRFNPVDTDHDGCCTFPVMYMPGD